MSDKQVKFLDFLFCEKSKKAHICIVCIDTDGNTLEKHFKGIKTAVNFCNRVKKTHNVFVNLAGTDGQGRKAVNQTERSVLAFDFDLKHFPDGLELADLVYKFKKIGLFYHCIVATGGGYHVYVKTEKTSDIADLVRINESYAVRLGADLKAVKTTQLLRVPNTYNYKYTEPRSVHVVHLADEVRPYKISSLALKCHEKSVNLKRVKDEPPCITEILKGVKKGERNFCQGRLVKHFQAKGQSESQVFALVREWNMRNQPPLSDSELAKVFQGYWSKDYNLLGCSSKAGGMTHLLENYCDKVACKKEGRVFLDATVKSFILHDVYCKKLGKELTGHHLMLMMLLGDGVATVEGLVARLISDKTGECLMTERTVVKWLKLLTSKGIVEKDGKTYKLKQLKDEGIKVSFMALDRAVDCGMGSSAFALYMVIFYRLSRGLSMTQSVISEETGLSCRTIIRGLQELSDCRFLNVLPDYSQNLKGVNRYELRI